RVAPRVLPALPNSAHCIIAFASACVQRHLSRPSPDLSSPLILAMQRGQPPSKQFFIPGGVPLYPVAICLFSLTITAPMCRVRQLDLSFAISACSVKYVSQSGLCITQARLQML